jgi:quercetin dioxygenase-like cupin family protein
MQIKRNGKQASQKGPDGWFTGTVRIDPIHTAPEPARVSAASVTFEPGARTAWHTHPLGQTLIIVSGTGWVQQGDGPIEEVSRATLSGFHQPSSTGKAQHRPPP